MIGIKRMAAGTAPRDFTPHSVWARALKGRNMLIRDVAYGLTDHLQVFADLEEIF